MRLVSQSELSSGRRFERLSSMALVPARHVTKPVDKDSSPAVPDLVHSGSDSDRIRSLLVASGLTASEAASAPKEAPSCRRVMSMLLPHSPRRRRCY
jgi:hypothetical protein